MQQSNTVYVIYAVHNIWVLLLPERHVSPCPWNVNKCLFFSCICLIALQLISVDHIILQLIYWQVDTLPLTTLSLASLISLSKSIKPLSDSSYSCKHSLTIPGYHTISIPSSSLSTYDRNSYISITFCT